MAACKSLQHIHDKPLPLRNHFKPLEVSVSFGDDSSSSLSPMSSPSCSLTSFSSSPFSSSSSSSSFPINFQPKVRRRRYSMSSESLSFCTENLGLERFNAYLSNGEPRVSRITGEEMPPPISSISRNGKPWVCFKSFRNDGRFVLREVKVPSQELVHSRREDGRLKLQYIQSDEETMDEDTADEM